jgi:hypothetical protein
MKDQKHATTPLHIVVSVLWPDDWCLDEKATERYRRVARLPGLLLHKGEGPLATPADHANLFLNRRGMVVRIAEGRHARHVRPLRKWSCAYPDVVFIVNVLAARDSAGEFAGTQVQVLSDGVWFDPAAVVGAFVAACDNDSPVLAALLEELSDAVSPDAWRKHRGMTRELARADELHYDLFAPDMLEGHEPDEPEEHTGPAPSMLERLMANLSN